MSEWISENADAVKWVLRKIEKKEDRLPTLVLEPMMLYKLRLLEGPHKVEGTDEGYMVRVRNEANRKEYALFLQRTLASNFRDIEAKKDDVLAVIVKGKNMQTGYEYGVGRWDSSFDEHMDRLRSIKDRKNK